MFNKFTTRILIKLAHMLENWARVIIKRIDENQQDYIELADESTSNMESISGADENQSGGPEKTTEESQSPVIANQQLQSESGGSRSKVQSRNPTVTDEHTSLMQHDESYETVALQEQVIPDSVRSPKSRQSLNDDFGMQTETQVALSPNSDTQNGTVIDSSINDHHKTKHSELSPTLNTVVNKHFDDDFPAISKCSEHSNELRESVERNSENNDVTADAAASEIIQQKILVKQNELTDSPTHVSDHAPDLFESSLSDSSITSSFGNNESSEESHKLPSPSYEEPSPSYEEVPVAVKAKQAGLQQVEKSTASAYRPDQKSSRNTGTITITSNSQTKHTASPATAESCWPKLPGETSLKSESQTESSAHPWPELSIDTTTTELGLLSSESMVSKTLVRDMERIQYLEREQKGLLWNA